jgi:hypothetical protein
MDQAAAERLIEKLRAFSAKQLDEQERALFAALLAPGIGAALREVEEVRGFDLDGGAVVALPEALVQALRSSGLRVVGLDETAP